MADYARHIAKAAAKIARYGSMAEFVSTEPAYDPISGQMIGGEKIEQAMAVLTKPDQKALASGSIQYGDAILLVPAGGLSERPKPGGIARMSSRTWRIVAIDEVAPDGTPILYKLQVRQA